MDNGASELIDLVIRSVQRGGWRPGNTVTQYKEYERSCQADGRETLAWNDSKAALTCVVNPTNPTGDYMDVEEMKQYIATNCPDNHTIIIDESMQPWVGPKWREDSKPVILIVVAPTSEHAAEIKRKQVPWSVNSMALAFVSAVVKDDAYLQKTWDVTPKWRLHAIEQLTKRFPNWEFFGKPFLSWIWLNTKSADISEKACKLAKEHGVPVRSGKPGYNLPTFVRIAVRSPDQTAVLLKAWKQLE
ncbi:unnamed protein product [Peronospora belbahrii]|uniref:Aminotransferase class I/classII domain-containing protein n=1 Tax=Peronospora belbahrii TaxID=622444 RepID=A0AAU9L4U1_9STRA|nr:unnamed protein product [Peronospora belbahrii]